LPIKFEFGKFCVKFIYIVPFLLCESVRIASFINIKNITKNNLDKKI